MDFAFLPGPQRLPTARWRRIQRSERLIPLSHRRASRSKIAAGVVLFLALGFWGLWQIDMVRQKVRITLMDLTGRIWKLHGHTETRMMASSALAQTRQVIVYLPPDYDLPANRDRKYPVMYLLHGFPDPGDGWVEFGLAPQLADQSIVNKELPPFIIVMADSHAALGKFGDGEYINAPAGNGRPGTKIADYITRDVPAWTDAHYRTIPTPLGRILAGSSTGGYAALNLGLKHPDKFGTLMAFSGYFAADLGHFGRELWGAVPDEKRVHEESPLDFVPTERRADWKTQLVYLGDGLQDYKSISPQTAQLADELRAQNVEVIHNRMPGHHSWDLWRLLFVDGLTAIKPRLTESANSGLPQTDSLDRKSK